MKILVNFSFSPKQPSFPYANCIAAKSAPIKTGRDTVASPYVVVLEYPYELALLQILFLEGTLLQQHALATQGLASLANLAPMPNKPMMRIAPFFHGNRLL